MTHAETTTFLLQISVMLACGVVFGQLARRAGQPAVVGELFAGIVLGPTFLGRFAPQLEATLFPASGAIAVSRDAAMKLCVIGFLFAAGLEINFHYVRRHARAVVTTSLLGVIVPFLCGYAVVRLVPSLWRQPIPIDQVAVFIGAALSITALPVIARIILDLEMEHSRVASVVLASATIDDLVGWTMFASVLAAVSPATRNPPWVAIIVVVVLTAILLTAGRRAVTWARPYARSQLATPGSRVAVAGVVVLVLATLMEVAGIHAIFGAFLAGAVMAQGFEKREQVHDIVHHFALGVLAPLYFVSVGLRANFVTSFDIVLVLVVTMIAFVGKVVGATAGARLGGLQFREALSIGMAMNARGAVEMILASVAFEARVIDERLFVALVMMALITSAAAGPAMKAIQARESASGSTTARA